MEPASVSSRLGHHSSIIINFKNPTLEDILVDVFLTGIAIFFKSEGCHEWIQRCLNRSQAKAGSHLNHKHTLAVDYGSLLSVVTPSCDNRLVIGDGNGRNHHYTNISYLPSTALV